jgi:hypothetical protein
VGGLVGVEAVGCEGEQSWRRGVFPGADSAMRMLTGKSVLGQVEFLFRELAEIWR